MIDPLIDRPIDGKYQTTRLLGQGGMGSVYEAVHTGTGRRVALPARPVLRGDLGELLGGRRARAWKKRWRYLLIPHDAIGDASTVAGLVGPAAKEGG